MTFDINQYNIIGEAAYIAWHRQINNKCDYVLDSDHIDIDPVASFVREARKMSQKTQSELAKDAGTSRAQIWRLENGIGTFGPSVDLLMRVARACGGNLKLSIE